MYYATGRDNVDYCEMKFQVFFLLWQTKKRHDLLFMLYGILFPEKDTVMIDLPIKTDIPLVFLVASKKGVKQLS